MDGDYDEDDDVDGDVVCVCVFAIHPYRTVHETLVLLLLLRNSSLYSSVSSLHLFPPFFILVVVVARAFNVCNTSLEMNHIIYVFKLILYMVIIYLYAQLNFLLEFMSAGTLVMCVHEPKCNNIMHNILSRFGTHAC